MVASVPSWSENFIMLYLLSPLSWLEPVCPLFMFSSFQEGSTGGSWYSSGFKARAKSGNVGAVSMILQSRLVHQYQLFYRSRMINENASRFLLSQASLTSHKSTNHGLSEPCLKYLLEFSQRDTSWFPKAADFCTKDGQVRPQETTSFQIEKMGMPIVILTKVMNILYKYLCKGYDILIIKSTSSSLNLWHKWVIKYSIRTEDLNLNPSSTLHPFNKGESSQRMKESVKAKIWIIKLSLPINFKFFGQAVIY